MAQKKLGLFTAVATGVGLILSTSCLLSLGLGVGPLGAGFLIAILAACALNICTALSLGELNAVLPNLTGGLAQYTLVCLGPFMTIVIMVGGYLFCLVLCSCAEVGMFGNVFTTLMPNTLSAKEYCYILLTIITAVNLLGVDMFAKVQNVIAYSLIAMMVVMGLFGIFHMGSGTPIEQPIALTWNISETFSMVGLAFFLFVGCEFIIPIAKDIKNPRITVPLGMVVSLLVVAVMDIAVMFGMSQYVPWAELGSSATPHLVYGIALFGETGMILMAITSILAAISTMNSTINALPHVCAGMANIGLLPKIFLKRNRFGAPFIGIALVVLPVYALVAVGFSEAEELGFLILIGCVFWMCSYIISNINVLVLRRTMPTVPRAFKVPFGPIIPLIGALGTLYMVLNIDSDPDTRNYILSICCGTFALIGAWAFVWIKFFMKKPLFKRFAIKDVMAMENEMYHIVRRH
ncbi:MAG: amino acid permease [Pseudomonadota bacterium]